MMRWQFVRLDLVDDEVTLRRTKVMDMSNHQLSYQNPSP